ncbi:hypothetical protein [Mucilaginibacter endophyticus]|uniref:hypothetical protein n=1 Tax=Mucilaginibacter endophyticus TaxID=2675003 RepID=UPI0012B16512|nr:hypothetical protein [Mucilaginibacter endophyticus]
MRGVNSQLSFILNLPFEWQSIAQSGILSDNSDGFALLFLHKWRLVVLALIRNPKASENKIDHLCHDFACNTKEELLNITGFKRPKQLKSVWLHHYIINYFLRNLKCFRGFDFAIDCVIEIKGFSQGR